MSPSTEPGGFGQWSVDATTGRYERDAALCRLVGGEPADALDAHLAAVHPEDRPRVEAALRAALSERAPWALQYRLAGGDLVLDRGAFEGAQGRGVVVDVTPIAERVIAAEDALRASHELLGVVSHDLRGPLGIFSMHATLEQEEAEDEDHRHEAEVLLRQVGLMERLVRDLVDFSRLERGGAPEMHVAPHAIRPLVERAIAERRHAGRRREIAFEAPGDAEADVLCDRDRLVQILGRLLDHAVRGTSDGGAIAVRLTLGPEHAEVTLTDEGAALSAEDLARAFGRGLAPAGSRRSNGLGLYLARRFAEAMGGALRAEGAARGTTFTLSLPRARVRPPEREAPTVLLVDDDAEFRHEAAEALRADGWQVAEARNGRAATAWLDASGPPRLVLLDLATPEADAWTLFARLKADPGLAGVPTVILSNGHEGATPPSLLGASDAVHKPISAERLRALARRYG
jgi:signal transduction histidine kinase/CheY-like chemotaxis protein